jgi:hypothetical protein
VNRETRDMLIAAVTALVVGAAAPDGAAAAGGTAVVAQATATPDAGKAAKTVDAAVVTVRGTVEAVDTEKRTVTLKGPKRSVTMQVQDPQKLAPSRSATPWSRSTTRRWRSS